MTKHLTLLLLIGLAWAQEEADEYIKSSQAKMNQQNIENYNITASSEGNFKSCGISKLKTTNESYSKGMVEVPRRFGVSLYSYHPITSW